MAEKYELAEKDYIKGMKYKDIAEKHDVSINTVKSWKVRHKWERNGVHTKEKSVHTKKKKDAKGAEPSKKAIERVMESKDLTEKQRLFCIYYVKSFNATQSAIKAGYSADTAHVQGPRLLGNVRIAQEIRDIKRDMTQEVYLSAKDVLDKYIKIAFSDITDYMAFGKKEIDDFNEDGEIETREVNFVEFKNSSEIDGTLVSEVKQGKDGVSIKLEDKMKALEKLSQYFDLFPDKFKRDIESEKLKIAQAKMSGGDDTQEKDVASALRGLVDAVNSQTD